MRKIASHYWLRPNGTVGKFPIIVFNEQNEIIEIREREAFLEESSLELVNGFLVPGFVDFFPPMQGRFSTLVIERLLKDYVRNGVRLLGVEPGLQQLMKSIAKKKLEIAESTSKYFIVGNTFDKVKSFNDSVEGLLKYTRQNANLLLRESKFGSLELGKTPSLLAIQKMNYDTFKISEESNLKIII